MRLDPDTLELLGWPRICAALAGRARTPQGAHQCRELAPQRDLDRLAAEHERLRQLAWLLDRNRPPPIEAIEEVEADLQRATKGGVLDAEALLRVARAMRVSSRVRAYLMDAGHQAGGALLELARGSHDLEPAGRDLAAAFEADGRLRDSASAELFALRRRAAKLADGLRARLERMIRTKRVADALSEPYVTLRSERHVLPVRSDSRGEVAGIVHDTSQSGATLFVEPAAVIDDGNRLKIAQGETAEEERRILAAFSREVAERAGALRDNVAALARADRQLAIVELGRALDGHLPELDGSGFALLAARHPLMALAGEPVVTNDIELAPERRALVVSGPNAGGKTVVLKTLGLCCLMAQAGLPIPAAEGSRLAAFDSLAAVIGDSQDISQGLSTFSAHVARIAAIMDRAGPASLVLLDELAADTDPRHGAALAAAILEELVERDATVLATTHYELLKQLPYDNPAFANASVGFDVERMEPTFRLHPDLPGRSLTLDIARRLGLAEPLLERAARRLAGGEQELDRMLESLESERSALEALRREMAAARARAEREVLEQRRAGQQLEQHRQQLLEQGRGELLAEIDSARARVAELIESLRTAPDMRRAVAASHELIELQRTLREQSAPTATETDSAAEAAPAPATTGEPRPGDRVRVQPLDKVGQVVSLDRAGRMVSVRLGPAHTRVPLERVSLVERAPARPEPRPAAQRSVPGGPGPGRPAAPAEVRTPRNTLDLRGQRVDEALARVERFLDDLFGAGEPSAFIVHGHGTGALRAAVREHLADSPYARHFRAGTDTEGGDGVTVVALK